MRRALAIVAVGALAGCAHSAAPLVTVGFGDTVEEQLLDEVYAQSLERIGMRVVRSEPLDRAGRLAALDGGRVMLVVEAAGAEVAFLGVNPTIEPVAYGPDAATAQAKALAGKLSAAVPSGIALADLTAAQPSSADSRPNYYVPIYRAGALDKAQTIAINKITGEVTTPELAQLVAAVSAGQSRHDAVAKWLDSRG